jgi:hypothetical protein
MKRKAIILSALIIVLGFSVQSIAQFTPEELAEREKWEKFLKDAEVIDSEQPWKDIEARTNPWRLTLEQNGVKHRAIWKDAQGRMRGFIENWKWEIAAYRLDKYLGLNMVPPTVEREFQRKRGSCQFYVENTPTLLVVQNEKRKKPSYKIYPFNLALYKQRAFDNLLYNKDRHLNQFLITDDWRIILIDHSRSFETTKKSTKKLIYDEKFAEGPRLMSQLPRTLVEKLREMNQEVIREVVGEYLTDKEIEAVLARRDLIIQWIEKRIKEVGEDKVLYD